jgi:hypothetical protein
LALNPGNGFSPEEKSPMQRSTNQNLNNLAFGFTLGYQINDKLGLTFDHKSAVNDSVPEIMQMDRLMVSLVAGWHELIEGAGRLKGSKQQL